MLGLGKGLPGDRWRIEHNVDTAFFTARGAVKANPALIMLLLALCSGRCVPFIIVCDKVATSRSFKLGARVRVIVRVWVRVKGRG